MLTRFVRIQLVIFTIVSIVGVATMAWVYLQAPALLGIGRITVTMELPATGGLYRSSNVTYRGVQIGKVTSLDLTRTAAVATMSIDSSPRISTDLVANVRSMSAVGEQYVDLQPRTDAAPYLEDGSVIPARDIRIPQPVGPMLDRVSALIGSIPKDKLNDLLDEAFNGLNGAGDDLGSLIDSGATLSHDFNAAADQSLSLIDDSGPLLDGLKKSADDTRVWARSLAGITEQLNQNDPQVRNILQTGPGLVQDVSRLLSQVKPTLPVLLANLASLGQVGVTYRPGLEQLLVLLPPSGAYFQAERPISNPTGWPIGDFRVAIDDPPACTVGFLPASQWRSPADTTEADTPDGLYCKLPQDSPIAVRGARNIPCMGHPGKRAPTVEICNSDKPFEPLAMRQHALGPPPIDPNLISQGVPPDARVPGQQEIFGPLAGTPLPLGAAPPPGSAVPDPSILAPPDLPDGGPGPLTAPSAAPSSYQGAASAGPSVAVAEYDPRTGRFLTPDGVAITETDLVAERPQSWQDLVMRPAP
jgi:phospholipid/cholesterol/gamma-HCH transport system substrate-binding protein